MKQKERWIWAVILVVADCADLFLPLLGLLAAYVVLQRPAWFKDWIDQVYRPD